MNLPPFVYVKAFWEFVSFILAGVLGLLAMFGVVPPTWAFGYVTILAWILGFLKMFKIEPEVRARMAAMKAKKAK